MAAKPKSSIKPSPEQLIALWTRVVETQEHFNEMSVKSRQLGLTFVAAALGLSIVLFNRSDDHYFWRFAVCDMQIELHVSVLIILATAFAVYGVRQLDLEVYHKMLRGAVTFGEDLEEQHLRKMLGLRMGMTQAISHFSRYTDADVDKSAPSGFRYTGSIRKNAREKIARFYTVVIVFLLLAATAILVISNLSLAPK